MRLKHYRVEVLVAALDGACCGKERVALTSDHRKVTCGKCRGLMGVDQ